MNPLSIIIPSRNLDNLEACVRAIRQMDEIATIIIVDDSDTSYGAAFQGGEPWEGVKRWCGVPTMVFPGIRPFVFARNVNIGIRAAGSSDVVILNDDALLRTPLGFTRLMNERQDHPEYGLIAATTNVVGNPNQLRQHIGLREDPRMVCFVAVFIPRVTINRVGLLDERFVGYGLDDDDYCLRVRKAGLKIGIHDHCYVDHGSLTSSYRGKGGAGGDFRSNLELFKQKWGMDNFEVPNPCPHCGGPTVPDLGSVCRACAPLEETV